MLDTYLCYCVNPNSTAININWIKLYSYTILIVWKPRAAIIFTFLILDNDFCMDLYTHKIVRSCQFTFLVAFLFHACICIHVRICIHIQVKMGPTTFLAALVTIGLAFCIKDNLNDCHQLWAAAPVHTPPSICYLWVGYHNRYTYLHNA